MPEIEIGLRIREMRKIKHYTRDVLSSKVGISSKFLYEIETGRKNFSAVILQKLARELDVSCDYIMTGEKTEQYEAVQFLKRLEALGSEKLARLQKLLDVLEGMCDLDSDSGSGTDSDDAGNNGSGENSNNADDNESSAYSGNAGNNESGDDSDNAGNNDSCSDSNNNNKKV